MSDIPCNCGRVVPDWEHHCMIHHATEEPRGGYYRCCGECWHIYATEADLERAHVLVGGPLLAADDIFSCPECAHDF